MAKISDRLERARAASSLQLVEDSIRTKLVEGLSFQQAESLREK